MRSLSFGKSAVLFSHAALVLLVAIGAASCRTWESPQRRYELATAALRHGKLPEARRLATFRPKSDSGWSSQFRVLEAEVILADGRAEEALRLLSGTVAEERLEARRLMIQGNALLKLDRYDEARRALDESAKKAADVKAFYLAVEVDLVKGSLLTIKNEVLEAGRILSETLAQARQLHDPYLQSQALNALAIQRIRTFRYDEALAFAAQALPFAIQAGAERLRAVELGNLSLCYARLGNFERAHAYAKEGVAIREELGDTSGLQIALGIIGNIYMLEGDARSAIPCYKRALEGARQLRAQSYSTVWAANLAEALAETGDWDGAAQLSREAQQNRFQDEQTRISAKLTLAEIAGGKKQFGEAERLLIEVIEVIESGPVNPAQLWEAHASLANIYRETGQLQRAGGHFEKAIRLMEKTRSELFKTEHRVTFLSRWIRFYQSYVDLLMEEGNSSRAFQVSELSRATILAETMGWRRAHARTAALSEYQTSARRMGAYLLSYWIAPRRSFLWVIAPSGTRTFNLPGEKEIAALVDAHQNSILDLRDPASSDQSPASRLYSVLLGEAAALIPALSKVILAPDGPLHNLNLETLMVAGQPSRYWVQDVTLSITPALSLLLGRPDVKSNLPTSLLVIGDPEPASRDYHKLPYARREIAAIERSFPNIVKAVFTGTRANPSAYRESRPERFSMIHFAAHGLANRTSPLDSAVVLSPQSGAFLLYAHDIAEHSLRARVVTIASCRSAGAKSYPGEGLLGLAWAFLRAGAHDVIAALWDVADQSTVEIMTTLYAGLATGKTPAEALHAAKVAMAGRTDSFRNPYYWGAFQNYISTARLPSKRARPSHANHE
jgi:CHAT domain-containing protein/predicted negative regulator of RcsB-dependent stress response